MELQREMITCCTNSKYVILMGDFNSRSGTMNAFINVETGKSGYRYLNDESIDIINNPDLDNIPLCRINMDVTVNT